VTGPADRLLCGLATRFDQPGLDGTPPWPASAFRRFVDLKLGVPLRVDHRSTPTLVQVGNALVNRPVESVGTVRRFAAVGEGTTPAGLLCLAELDPGDPGDALLWDLQRGLDPRSGARPWGLSVGGYGVEYGGAIEQVLPREISLTTDPAWPDALVLAVGADALRTWELLTGSG
jgi:hypothetical protein